MNRQLVKANINTKLRPLRFALLVNPYNEANINQAIEINSWLWGGVYNPIIPFFSRIPSHWKKWPRHKSTAKSVITGLIDAYDPDIILNISDKPVDGLDVGNREVINLEQMYDGDSHIPEYGISVTETINHLIQKELRFKRLHPINFRFPVWGETYSTMYCSIFGSLPKPVGDRITSIDQEVLNASKPEIDLSSFLDILVEDSLSYIDIGSLYIRTYSLDRGLSRNYLLLIDASKPIDVIEYWNLRALGWNVLPVPVQGIEEPSFLARLRETIVQYSEDRTKKKIRPATTILSTQSLPREYIDELRDKIFDEEHSELVASDHIVTQHWYPRIWDAWDREHNGGIPCSTRTDQSEVDIVVDEDGWFSVPYLAPKFYSDYRSIGYANEVSFRVRGNDDPIAEVIPDGDWELSRAISITGYKDWRFSKGKVIYLSSREKGSITLKTPKAEEVYKAWCKSMGWEIELSPPGRIAKQMLAQLGGIYGVSLLADIGTVELLTTELENGKPLSGKLLKSKVAQIANKSEFRNDHKQLFKLISESKMLDVGLEVRCTVCMQSNWYPVNVLRNELNCHHCMSTFDFPYDPEKQAKWSYKTIGPFALANKSMGVYPVLLTLRFFTNGFDGWASTTSHLSFNAPIGPKGAPKEIDLGLLYNESRYGHNRIWKVFAECKTHSRFKREDITRIKVIRSKFPESLIVFATLKPSLSSREKKLIIPLVNHSRRARKSGNRHTSILVLTSNELCSVYGPPDAWKNKSALHKQMAEKHKRQSIGIKELSDATQMLYLGLESWDDWIKQRIDQGRK